MSKVAFEHFSERMEKINKKLEALENEMNEKLDRLERTILNGFKAVG